MSVLFQISQFSQSTSVRAEAESIGSPGKQEKMVMDDREQRHEVSRYADFTAHIFLKNSNFLYILLLIL